MDSDNEGYQRILVEFYGGVIKGLWYWLVKNPLVEPCPEIVTKRRQLGCASGWGRGQRVRWMPRACPQADGLLPPSRAYAGLHHTVLFTLVWFWNFPQSKVEEKKTQQRTLRVEKGTLVQLSDLTDGTELRNDSFKMMLTPARVFTPTESIKLTCVKSRMMVWTLSPGGMNLCSSSGSVLLMTIGGYFTSSPSSSGFVASSPSTSASCQRVNQTKSLWTAHGLALKEIYEGKLVPLLSSCWLRQTSSKAFAISPPLMWQKGCAHNIQF